VVSAFFFLWLLVLVSPAEASAVAALDPSALMSDFLDFLEDFFVDEEAEELSAADVSSAVAADFLDFLLFLLVVEVA